VAKDCNPSYSGGRDPEDHSLKPTPGKEFAKPCLQKTHQNKGLAEWLKVKALRSSPSIAINI
jgi:hypothetical protein